MEWLYFFPFYIACFSSVKSVKLQDDKENEDFSEPSLFCLTPSKEQWRHKSSTPTPDTCTLLHSREILALIFSDKRLEKPLWEHCLRPNTPPIFHYISFNNWLSKRSSAFHDYPCFFVHIKFTLTVAVTHVFNC